MHNNKINYSENNSSKKFGTQLDILQEEYCTLNVAECLLAANLLTKLLTSIKHCFEIVQAQDNRCLYGIKEDRAIYGAVLPRAEGNLCAV